MIDYQAQLDLANTKNAFMLHNGIRAVSVSETEAVCEADALPESLNHMGTVHGSMMMTIGEIAAGLMARSDGRPYVSVGADFRFIGGGKAGEKIVAHAELVKRGRTMAFIHTRVLQGDNLLLAGNVTFYCTAK